MLWQKLKKKSRSRGEKRERLQFSYSSLTSRSSFSLSSESGNEMVDKCFKKPKGKEFEKNLSSIIAYCANLHFKNFIPDKDINGKMLGEHSVPSNLQEFPLLDDFLITLLVSKTAISTEKFQDKLYKSRVRYHNSRKYLKIFETSLLKLWKYL